MYVKLNHAFLFNHLLSTAFIHLNISSLYKKILQLDLPRCGHSPSEAPEPQRWTMHNPPGAQISRARAELRLELRREEQRLKRNGDKKRRLKSGRQRAPEEGREGQPSSGGQIDGCCGRHRRRNGQSKKSSSANLNMAGGGDA